MKRTVAQLGGGHDPAEIFSYLGAPIGMGHNTGKEPLKTMGPYVRYP